MSGSQTSDSLVRRHSSDHLLGYDLRWHNTWQHTIDADVLLRLQDRRHRSNEIEHRRFRTVVLRIARMRVHRCDAGSGYDYTTGLLVLPHEVDGQLSAVEDAFVVHVCAGGRRCRRDCGAVAMGEDEDRGLVNYAGVCAEGVDAAV